MSNVPACWLHVHVEGVASCGHLITPELKRRVGRSVLRRLKAAAYLPQTPIRVCVG